MTNTFDLHTIILTAVSTGAAGKLMLMAARTMPPPPASCGFICRWSYDFIQAFAENQDKVGKTQAQGQPVGVEQPVATLSKQVAEVPNQTTGERV